MAQRADLWGKGGKRFWILCGARNGSIARGFVVVGAGAGWGRTDHADAGGAGGELWKVMALKHLWVAARWQRLGFGGYNFGLRLGRRDWRWGSTAR